MKSNKNKNNQLSLFNIEQKIEQSTATVTELRVPIFLPFKKIAHNSKIALEFKKNGGKISFSTSWGNVTIRGRKLLTDVHRDILDCIYTYNRNTILCQTGEIEIFFTLTSVLKHYGQKNPNANISWLKDRIEEIRDTAVQYSNNKDDSFDFNIIANLDYLNEARMYKLTLDKRYVKFYENELSISYKKELPNLLKVDSALVKTIIRWFFTHKEQCSYRLITVFEAIGMKLDMLSLRMQQINKKTLREHNSELNRFGINYNHEEDIFTYAGNQNVSFIPSVYNHYKQIDPKKTTTLNDYVNVKVIIENEEYIINKVELETSNNDVKQALIHTTTGEALQYLNQLNKPKDEFTKEIISWLDSIKK